MSDRAVLIWAFGLGAAGIMIGAFGAHVVPGWLKSQALDPVEIANRMDRIEIGARYHMYHVLALFGLGLFIRVRDVNAGFTAPCFLVGILLFSGCLYGYGITGVRWLGAIVPLGGLSFIVGWLNLLRVAIQLPR